MGIIEMISKHWDIAALLGGGVWVGRISQKVSDLRKRMSLVELRDCGMSPDDCSENRTSCRAEILGDLDAGRREFDEVKSQIKSVDKAAEDRHKIVIDHLLRLKRGE